MMRLVVWMVLFAAPVGAQKFYPDDPLLVDDDKLDVANQPAEIELSADPAAGAADGSRPGWGPGGRITSAGCPESKPA